MSWEGKKIKIKDTHGIGGLKIGDVITVSENPNKILTVNGEIYEKLYSLHKYSVWAFPSKKDKTWKVIEEFVPEVGKYYYIIDKRNSALEAGKVYKLNDIYNNTTYHFDNDGKNLKNNACWLVSSSFREATPEEISILCPYIDSYTKDYKIGEYYKVEDGDFWMIGKAVEEAVKESDGEYRGKAYFISSQNKFVIDRWAIGKETGKRKYKKAAPEEIKWLDACIKAGKYLSLEKALKQEEPLGWYEALESYGYRKVIKIDGDTAYYEKYILSCGDVGEGKKTPINYFSSWKYCEDQETIEKMWQSPKPKENKGWEPKVGDWVKIKDNQLPITINWLGEGGRFTHQGPFLVEEISGECVRKLSGIKCSLSFTRFDPSSPPEVSKWIPKVGDWVVITKSSQNWAEGEMDKFVGKCVQITWANGDKIDFEGSEYWTWRLSEGHFRKAFPHEIPVVFCPENSSAIAKNPQWVYGIDPYKTMDEVLIKIDYLPDLKTTSENNYIDTNVKFDPLITTNLKEKQELIYF